MDSSRRKKKVSTDKDIIEIIALRDEALSLATTDKEKEDIGQICKGMYFCSKKREEAPKDCLPKKKDALMAWISSNGGKMLKSKKAVLTAVGAGRKKKRTVGRSKSRSRSRSRSKPRSKSKSRR